MANAEYMGGSELKQIAGVLLTREIAELKCAEALALAESTLPTIMASAALPLSAIRHQAEELVRKNASPTPRHSSLVPALYDEDKDFLVLGESQSEKACDCLCHDQL